MTTLRKFWWASIAPALVVTGLTVGCTTEEPPSTSPAPSTSTPAPKKTSDIESTKNDVTAPAPAPASAPSAPTKPDAKDDAPVLTPPKVEDTPKSGDSPKAAAIKLTAEEIAAIKTLPAADQAIALQQKVCPVSGSHLGDEGMGAPVKITAEGRTFFLCCKGCEDEVKADPKAIIAKLGK
jgi:hypothetical protein